MKIFAIIWNHKQAITGAVTSLTSTLAVAGVLSPETGVKIAAVAGALVTLLALAYSIQTQIESDPAKPDEPPGNP